MWGDGERRLRTVRRLAHAAGAEVCGATASGACGGGWRYAPYIRAASMLMSLL